MSVLDAVSTMKIWHGGGMARIAIVTGAASGIGAALAKALAAEGDTVVLADVDIAGASRVAGQIGANAQAFEVNVADAGAVESLVNRTVGDHGRIDLMVNNAGIGVGGGSEQLRPEHWDRIIDVNVKGVAYGVCAVLPHMLRQGDGHIVNTASLAGLIPAPMLTAYAAAKHAVVGMTLSMRVEFAGRGVRFMALCPGFTETPILDRPNPADLPEMTGALTARAIASALPGGVYELDKLIDDVLYGIEENLALVVAPQSARSIWEAFRADPEGYMAVAAVQMPTK